MEDLVQIKGIKGKQNKKKWAKNIDLSKLLEKQAQQHTNLIKQKFQQQQISEDLSSRKLLDPNRFKNNKKNALKIKHNNEIVKQSIFDGQIEDIWKDNNNSQLKHKNQAIEIPAVIKPPNGHSYNPNEQHIEQIIEQVIDYEQPKQKIKRVKKLKTIRKIIPRARNLKMRQQQLKSRQRKQEKRNNHQINFQAALIKEIDEQNILSEKRQQEKKQKKQKQKKQFINGKVRLGRNIGKKKYQFRQYIPKKQEINNKMSLIKNSSQILLNDRYDSIFRRGIFEQRTIKIHANKIKNIKIKQKIHLQQQ